jgi:hypothetical protein
MGTSRRVLVEGWDRGAVQLREAMQGAVGLSASAALLASAVPRERAARLVLVARREQAEMTQAAALLGLVEATTEWMTASRPLHDYASCRPGPIDPRWDGEASELREVVARMTPR